jgi:hypothetical protein
MKRIISHFACGFIILFSLATNAVAQERNDISMVRPSIEQGTVLTTGHSMPGATNLLTMEQMQQKSPRLLKNLQQQFPDAGNVQFYESPDGFYISLTAEGNPARLFYNTGQKFRYSILQVDRETLPSNLLRMLESGYAGFSIQAAYKVTQAGATDVYRIILRHQQQFVEVISDGEELTEVKNLHGL